MSDLRASEESGAVGAAFRRSRVAVTATFAMHAVMAGTLGPWIPRLKADNGLDAAGLGLALTGYAVGLVAGTRLAGPALARTGGRRVVRAGIPALGAGLALLPVANGLGQLAAIFVGFGLASGLLDVAMNTEAVAVERRFGRRVMSGMHGAWSASVLAGAALASVAIAAGIPIGIDLSLVAVVLTLASIPLLRWLPSSEPVRADAEVKAASTSDGAIPRVVLLCLVASSAFLSEGVAVEWSAVFLRETLGADAGTAGVGVVAFSAGMAASRFAGDRLSARIDPTTLARAGASLGAIMLAAAVASESAVVSIVALAIVGVGLGPVVPLAFRAAGGVALGVGRTALGVVVTAGYVGSIVGPLAVGFTADQAGLQAGFVVPVAACVVAALASGAIRDRGT
ncbi:MAG: MFS transporter [Actinomycetota bacterium]